MMRWIVAGLWMFGGALSVEGNLLERNLLPAPEAVQVTGAVLTPAPQGAGFEVKLSGEGGGRGVVVLPVTIGDWRIFDHLELVIESSDPQGVFQVEVFERTPPENTFLKPRETTLVPGRQTYRYPLPRGGVRSDVARVQLSFYHRLDNMHVPESVIERPVTIRGLALSASNDQIQTFEAARADLFAVRYGADEGGERLGTFHAARRQHLARYNRLIGRLRQRLADPEKQAVLEELHQLREELPWQLEEAALADLLKDREVVHGWVSGGEKVFRRQALPGRIGGVGQVQLARRETEGLQLALFAAEDLTGLQVVTDGFVQEGGQRLDAEQVQIVPVGYVKTLKPQYHVQHVGWTPDPLLTELSDFAIEARHWQPVWLDIRTQADQAPGIYRGTVQVLRAGERLIEVPLEIEVWDFSLPEVMRFPVAISSDTDRRLSPMARFYCRDVAELERYEAFMLSEEHDLDAQTPAVQRLFAIRNQTQAMLREHHVHQTNIYRRRPQPITGWQRREVLEHGGSMFNIGYVHYADPQPVMAWLDEQMAKMQADGTADKGYLYGYDEIVTQQDFENMRRVFGAIKERYPDLPLMATALDYTYGQRTGTRDVVDIWVVPTPNYMGSRRAAAEARQAGKQVWWYTCNWPFPPSANFLLENTASAHRLLMGFMPWKFEVDGYLYYHTTLWRTWRYHGNLLGAWTPFGEARVIELGPTGNGDDAVVISATSADHNSGVWQTVTLNQQEPITLHFAAESRVVSLGAGSPQDHAMTMFVHYVDGSRDDVALASFPTDAGDWRRTEAVWTPDRPVRQVSLNLRLRQRSGEVWFRGAEVRQAGEPAPRNTLWHEPMVGGPLTNHDGKGFRDHNGDGCLIYPGEHGTLPTIRLKTLRDGLEDYEYLALLRDAVEVMRSAPRTRATEAWLQQAEAALVIGEDLVTSLTRYSLTSEPLLARRAAVGALLVRFADLRPGS